MTTTSYSLAQKIECLEGNAVLSERQRIELQYAKNDIGRAKEALERIARKRKAIEDADIAFKKNKKIS